MTSTLQRTSERQTFDPTKLSREATASRRISDRQTFAAPATLRMSDDQIFMTSALQRTSERQIFDPTKFASRGNAASRTSGRQTFARPATLRMSDAQIFMASFWMPSATGVISSLTVRPRPRSASASFLCRQATGRRGASAAGGVSALRRFGASSARRSGSSRTR